MKKAVSMCVVALIAFCMLTGCGNSNTTKPDEATTGKLVINFEGMVSDVEESCITLDNGQNVIFDEETIFTDVNGTVENPALTVGDYIQGYTENDPSDAEITAKRIHIVVLE